MAHEHADNQGKTAACFTLYRFYDRDGGLLYVGRSINPGKRMEKHRATKSWWADVAAISMEQCSSLEQLRAAERAAIQAEAPTHNQRLNGRRAAVRTASVDVEAPERCQEWFAGVRAVRHQAGVEGPCWGVATYRAFPFGREVGEVIYVCGRCVEFYSHWEPAE